MKIKEQTRKLAAGCSKYSFEVVDKTDEVSDYIYGKATLTWFEEIFEEYKHKKGTSFFSWLLLFYPQNSVLGFFTNDQNTIFHISF